MSVKITVGAGSAGSLVANRLSANYSVLLLEFGGEPHPLHLLPAFSLFLLNYPQIDWQHRTVPQKYSTFAQNRQVNFPSANQLLNFTCVSSSVDLIFLLLSQESLLSQGVGLGGTSNINFLMYSRGNPRDFDAWAEIIGDPEWNYENLIPFFKKHENYIRKSPSEYSYGVAGRH